MQSKEKSSSSSSLPKRLFPWSSRRSEKQPQKHNVFMLHEGSAGDVSKFYHFTHFSLVIDLIACLVRVVFNRYAGLERHTFE